MPILDKLAGVFAGNLGDTVAKIIGVFKLSPEQAAEHATELAKIQADAVSAQLNAANTEMEAAAKIITAEAQSQSWLPRNVRPLLLLIWGAAITVNVIAPVVARFAGVSWEPIPVDPWVYKLTAVGFTGYVTARTWEKVTGGDQ